MFTTFPKESNLVHLRCNILWSVTSVNFWNCPYSDNLLNCSWCRNIYSELILQPYLEASHMHLRYKEQLRGKCSLVQTLMGYLFLVVMTPPFSLIITLTLSLANPITFSIRMPCMLKKCLIDLKIPWAVQSFTSSKLKKNDHMVSEH